MAKGSKRAKQARRLNLNNPPPPTGPLLPPVDYKPVHATLQAHYSHTLSLLHHHSLSSGIALLNQCTRRHHRALQRAHNERLRLARLLLLAIPYFYIRIPKLSSESIIPPNPMSHPPGSPRRRVGYKARLEGAKEEALKWLSLVEVWEDDIRKLETQVRGAQWVRDADGRISLR